jgi:hypothetical protein
MMTLSIEMLSGSLIPVFGCTAFIICMLPSRITNSPFKPAASLNLDAAGNGMEAASKRQAHRLVNVQAHFGRQHDHQWTE